MRLLDLFSGAGGCSHGSEPVASVFGWGGASALSKRLIGRTKGYVPHVDVCRDLMGARWMNKRELSQSIPPAYTEFLGAQLLRAMSAVAA